MNKSGARLGEFLSSLGFKEMSSTARERLTLPKPPLAMAVICPGYPMPTADWDFGCFWVPIKIFLYFCICPITVLVREMVDG